METIDLSQGDVALEIPVIYDGKRLGHLQILVTEHASQLGGVPNCYISFLEQDPNEPLTGSTPDS